MKHSNQCRHAFQSTMIVFLILVVLLMSHYSQAQIHFNINLEITPALKTIKNQMSIQATKDKQPLQFFLNKNLTINVLSLDDKIILLQPAKQDELGNIWELQFGSFDDNVDLQIIGVLDSIQITGLTLDPNTFWLPTLNHQLFTFNMTLQLPLNWRAMTAGQVVQWSNGQFNSTSTFKQIYPQQDLHLIAGKFQITSSTNSDMWTKTSMPELTEKYLKLSETYLERYSQIIGKYPYQRMTIIEDDSDMGLGFPGYTTLGSRVIQLPFILNSSLPHEILHNWFGNSIYPDPHSGNWSEGLTTYLADHYEKTLIHQDREYRLNALIGFQDFVKPENEMTLNEFRGRYNEASQSIGYGKSFMFFHMIKTSVGSENFNQCIKEFYIQKQFTYASYNDFLHICANVSKKIDLVEQFQPFLHQKGMIEVELEQAHLKSTSKGYELKLTLKQIQEYKYQIDIPIRIFKDQKEYITELIQLKKDSNEYAIQIEFKAVKIELDPDLDLFRKLYPQERPRTFSKVYSSKKIHVYGEIKEQLQALTQNLKLQEKNVQFVYHSLDELTQLPIKEDILLVGNHPQITQIINDHVHENQFKIKNNYAQFQDQSYDLTTNYLTLVTTGKVDSEQNIWWINLPKKNDISLFTRKIQHYNKKSFLVFDNQLTNQIQTQWITTISPLTKIIELNSKNITLAR